MYESYYSNGTTNNGSSDIFRSTNNQSPNLALFRRELSANAHYFILGQMLYFDTRTSSIEGIDAVLPQVVTVCFYINLIRRDISSRRKNVL